MPARSWMWVGWPSFLMAGVLEMLVFAVVDPRELHWQGGALDWSRPAVYTVAFFMFWAVIALSSALSVWLAQDLRRRSAD
jgi:hypothetical protein